MHGTRTSGFQVRPGRPLRLAARTAPYVLLGACLAAPAGSAADAVELSELLAASGNAATVLEAEADSASARSEVERERAAGGLRVQFGGGYGLVRNIVDTNRAFTYSQAQAQAGFSLPLLDSAEKTTRNVDIALGKAGESSARASDARRLAGVEIERDYAADWGAQESMKVIDAYLASEDSLMPRLRLRAQNRLMLQSDLLDAQASYEQARDDRWRMQRIEQQAASRIQLLTGRDLDSLPLLPVDLPPVDAVDVDRVIARHPDLQALRAHEDSLERQRKDSTWYGIDASLDVAGTGVKDMSQGGPNGGTAIAALNVSMPVSLFSVRSAEHRRLRAEVDAAHQRYWQRSQELVGEVKAALLQMQQAQQQQALAERRTEAAHEALRESSLRGGVFADEGVEVLSRRMRTYYSMAMDLLDARVKAWQANVDLRGYANVAALEELPAPATDRSGSLGEQLAAALTGTGLQPPPAAAPPAAAPAPAAPTPAVPPQSPATIHGFPVKPAPRFYPPRPQARLEPPRAAALPAVFRGPGPGRLLPVSLRAANAGAHTGQELAVYVWNGAELLGQLQDSAKFWHGLDGLGINRLLLALNAQQIEQARSQPQQLARFLERARQHRVAVELLLGDPHWIEPDQRGKLVAIVQGLSGFGFAGLDLDIEPDQLFSQPLRRADFDAWVQTLAAAAHAAPWPVAVSVHPRYFRDPPYLQWNLAQRLQQGGVGEATLMVYSSNPQRVADIVAPIAAAAPRLRFRVAQSVEPELEPQLSYANAGPARFESSMQRLQALLQAQPNVDGVVVQGWADLMKMGYESQVR